MATNGANSSSDADMTDYDGEKVVTMMDVLQEQEDFEEDANAVLGASDDKNCTYSKGYVKRQAIYACLTCCPDAKTDPMKRAGVCLACSLSCHENHDLVELYTKRNFRCDCGNPKFNSHPCQFTPNKSDLNYENKYNQNFIGVYCVCHRPYPDPEAPEEDEMIQCIICEDWLHTSHLDATVPLNDQYAEMICKDCLEDNDFIYDYSELAINTVDKEITVTDPDLDVDLSSIFKKPAVPNGDSNKDLVNGKTESKPDCPDEKSNNVPDKLEGKTDKNEQNDSLIDVEMTEAKPDEGGDKEVTENFKEIVGDKSDIPTEAMEEKPEGEQSGEKIDQDSKNNSSEDTKSELVNEKEQGTDGEVKTDSVAESVSNENSEENENQGKSVDENNINETNQEAKSEDLDPETLEKIEEDRLLQEDTEIDKKSESTANDDKTSGQSNNEEKSELPAKQDINDPEKTGNESVTDANMTSTSKDDSDKEDQISVDNKENKRKLSTDEEVDDQTLKKPKLDMKKCVRPRGVKGTYKGAIFWPSNFRQKLCTCNECISMYKDLAVLFLIDQDDTVTAYEALGKERTDGAPSSQYEKGLQALSSLDRVQQINALTEYNKMRDKLLDFLKSFKDRKEVVKEEDIKTFFAGMKPKREPDGVYFCR